MFMGDEGDVWNCRCLMLEGGLGWNACNWSDHHGHHAVPH